jgi:hypothetical protein
VVPLFESSRSHRGQRRARQDHAENNLAGHHPVGQFSHLPVAEQEMLVRRAHSKRCAVGHGSGGCPNACLECPFRANGRSSTVGPEEAGIGNAANNIGNAYQSIGVCVERASEAVGDCARSSDDGLVRVDGTSGWRTIEEAVETGRNAEAARSGSGTVCVGVDGTGNAVGKTSVASCGGLVCVDGAWRDGGTVVAGTGHARSATGRAVCVGRTGQTVDNCAAAPKVGIDWAGGRRYAARPVVAGWCEGECRVRVCEKDRGSCCCVALRVGGHIAQQWIAAQRPVVRFISRWLAVWPQEKKNTCCQVGITPLTRFEGSLKLPHEQMYRC